MLLLSRPVTLLLWDTRFPRCRNGLMHKQSQCARDRRHTDHRPVVHLPSGGERTCSGTAGSKRDHYRTKLRGIITKTLDFPFGFFVIKVLRFYPKNSQSLCIYFNCKMVSNSQFNAFYESSSTCSVWVPTAPKNLSHMQLYLMWLNIWADKSHCYTFSSPRGHRGERRI